MKTEGSMSKSRTHFRNGRILPLIVLSFISVAAYTAIIFSTHVFSHVPSGTQIAAKMNNYPFRNQVAIQNVMPELSGWLDGWEGMADILVITIIAELILLALFLAFIADGLEEYFRDRRNSEKKKVSQSTDSRWERLTAFIRGAAAKTTGPIRTRF